MFFSMSSVRSPSPVIFMASKNYELFPANVYENQ